MNPKYSKYYTFIRPVVNNKAVKTYSFLIFSLITSTVMIIFAIQPTVKTIVSLQKSINEQKEILERARKKIDDLSLGEQNYQKLPQVVRSNLFTLIPSAPTPDKNSAVPTLSLFIADISSVAASNNLRVTGLQLQKTPLVIENGTTSASTVLKSVEFTLNAQGEYAKLVNFLNTLGNINHLVTIDSVNFIKPADATLLLSVNGKVYYLDNN